MTLTKEQRDEIEKRVFGLVSEQSGESFNYVIPTARLKKDLGLDSMDFIELTMELEEEFSSNDFVHDFVFDISDEEQEGIKTVGDIVNLVIQKIEAEG